MKWFSLYKKLKKLNLNKIQKTDVIAVVNGKEIPMLLKCKEDGSPYLISKEEFNYNHCKKCSNYDEHDGYDDYVDISKCDKCKYFDK